MTTDFRKLCAELAHDLGLWLEFSGSPADLPLEEEASFKLVKRAQALLAQDEPQPPADQEIKDFLNAWWEEQPEGFLTTDDEVRFVRAILQRFTLPF